MKKICLALIISAVLLFVTINFAPKKIFVFAEVEGAKKIVTITDAKKNLPLKINFVHSVQKTPVVEELTFDGENFILLRTIYQSHGVGLPFLKSDGTFREVDGKFIFDNMHRKIKSLELRTGQGTKLCIELGGELFELYKKFPAGTKIIFVRNF